MFKKILRWALRIILFIGLAFVIMITIFTNGFSFRKTDAQTEKYFAKANVPVTIHHDTYKGGPVRWVETPPLSDNTNTLMVFVHGAPGAADAFHSYLADSPMRSRCRMVSIDRLGYGYSHYGKTTVDIGEQADFVRFVMSKYDADTVWLTGHSFGGPIVAKVAMDAPEDIEGVVMIAPVNDPVSEKIFWFSGIPTWKALKWMMSGGLIVSAEEKLGHIEALKQIQDGWATIRRPILHIHGMKDSLAPADNMDFSKKNIPAEFLRTDMLMQSGHIIPFTQFEYTRNSLINAMDKTYWQ